MYVSYNQSTLIYFLYIANILQKRLLTVQFDCLSVLCDKNAKPTNLKHETIFQMNTEKFRQSKMVNGHYNKNRMNIKIQS